MVQPVMLQQHSPVVINFSAFDLQTQPFLGHHPIFHLFYTCFYYSRGHAVFLQLGCFGVDHAIKLALISNSMQLLFALVSVSIYVHVCRIALVLKHYQLSAILDVQCLLFAYL